MNNKIYRLLRSNKEQGPFTKEELIQKGLKPFDLIWVDGRSAAWSYPDEMAELKAYLPQTQQVNTGVSVKQVNRISSAVQAAVAVNENLKQVGIKKEKPRYKVSAAWSKIQTVTAPSFNVLVDEPKKSSSNKLVEATPNSINAKSLSWEEAWHDWEKEKSTTPVKIQTAILPKKEVKETAYVAPVLETKFEQSLDTITDNYIDNLLTKKKKAKGFSLGKSSEFVLPSLALLVIFSVGYWLLHNNTVASALSIPQASTQQTTSSTRPVENTASTPNNNSAATQNKIASQPIENNTTSTPEVKDKIIHTAAKTSAPLATTTAVKQPVVLNNANASNNTAAVNTASAKPGTVAGKQFDPSVINNVPGGDVYNDAATAANGDRNAAAARPVRRRTNAGDDAATNNSNNDASTSSNNNSASNTKSKTVANFVSVPEYIKMDNNGSGSVKVQNNSDMDLDLVVVDVQYYDTSGRYRKGETLYLHNLRAGKSVNIKTSRDINSAYATSKVSVVSSEANGIYAVGDN